LFSLTDGLAAANDVHRMNEVFVQND